MEALPLPNSTHPLYCNTSTGTQRPLVPLPWRHTVFDSLHRLSHPGIRATQKLITSHFVWPGINSDVRHWTRSCIQCQGAKIQRHNILHYPHFPPPMLVLTSSTLILLDPYHHLKDSPTSSPALTATLAGRKPFPSPPARLKLWLRPSSVGGFLVLVFPQPSSRTVDANLNPISGRTSCLSSVPNMLKYHHPQSNGMVERFHCQLKTAFEAQPNLDAWMDTLPFILLSIRTASGGPQHNRSGNGIWHHTPSPTTSLLDPSEFLNRLRTHFRTISPVSLRPTQRTTNIADGLAKATHVFVRYDVVCKPLQPANILWQYELTNTLRSQLMAATLPSQSIASSPFIWTSNQIRNTHLLLQNRYQMNNLITYPSLPTSLLILIHHFHPRTLPPSHSSIHTPTIPRSTRSGHRVHFPQYFSHHV